jgi:uncharacterized membrane protein YtjA (UPF0391 family)
MNPFNQPPLPAMLHYTFLFLIIGLLAALIGFSGMAGTATRFVKAVFVISILLFCVELLVGYKVI